MINKSNPFIQYYVNQAGSGLSAYSGVRFQRGNGFFGRLFRGAVLPVLKYIGRQALMTGTDVARDTLAGSDIKESFENRLKEAGKTIANRANTYIQTGKGRRKKKSINIKPKKKKRKVDKISLVL